MPRPSRFKSAGLRYLYDRFIGDDPERVASYERAVANAEVAQAIYDLRTQAKLTQAELANRMGTTPSVISRLEDADYEGHSLSMLRRVAAALGMRVEIRFAALENERESLPRPSKATGTRRSTTTKAEPMSRARRAALAAEGRPVPALEDEPNEVPIPDQEEMATEPRRKPARGAKTKRSKTGTPTK